MTLTLLPLTLWTALLGGVAWAGGGEHGGPPMTAIAIHAVNFVLLVGILVFVARTPLSDFLKMRSGRIRKDIEDAARAQAEARSRYEDLEARLNNFERQLADLRAEGEADAAREAALLEERTRQDLRQIEANAERVIREEVRKAKVALQAQAVDLAVRVAEEQIRGQMTPADHDRLAQEFLGAVRKETAHG